MVNRKVPVDIFVNENGAVRTVQAEAGETLLAVLRRTGAPIIAPCGGNGTCGKCEVGIRTAEGLSRALACQTTPADGMEVFMDDAGAIRVSDDAADDIATRFALDAHAAGELGAAVDLGTTTIACYLYDMHNGALLARRGTANPQASFGADVISRIQACSEGNLETLQERAAARIDSLISECCADVGADCSRVVRVAIAGNPTMEHIVCGISPQTIGVSPFTPVSLFGDMRNVAYLADGVFLAPCVSGYVGGDITAGLLACDLDRTEKRVLFADLGTNGELALVDGDALYCCATATGPAFEGANILMGMQARPGAIDSCTYRNGSLQISVIGDAKPVGICGSGLIDVLATCIEIGLVDETGRLLEADELPWELARLLGNHEGRTVVNLVDDGSVVFTQMDIRALQLAKAAVGAGMATLVHEAGLVVGDVDELVIGGAFGAHIDPASAAAIGLFPPELLPVVSMVGNCAGKGVSAALVSQQARDRLQAIAANARYIELSCNQGFSNAYIDAMMFGED